MRSIRFALRRYRLFGAAACAVALALGTGAAVEASTSSGSQAVACAAGTNVQTAERPGLRHQRQRR